MFTAPSSMVYPRMREAENQCWRFTPDDPELDVTLPRVCCSEVNTPRLDSTKYRKATATNSTTQATRDIRKLNFITDHGSSRATTRSARRAWTWPPGVGLGRAVDPGLAEAAPAAP